MGWLRLHFNGYAVILTFLCPAGVWCGAEISLMFMATTRYHELLFSTSTTDEGGTGRGLSRGDGRLEGKWVRLVSLTFSLGLFRSRMLDWIHVLLR